MDCTTYRKNLTASGESDVPEAGDVSGLVPARPSSPSSVGLSQVLPAGACEELVTAEKETEVNDSDREPMTRIAGGEGVFEMVIIPSLSRSSSQVSLQSIRSVCSMEIEKEKENRKRKKGLTEKGQVKEGEDEEEEDRILTRKVRKARKILQSEEETGSGKQEDIQNDKDRHMVIISDDEDAECFTALHTNKKVGKGDEEEIGIRKDGKHLDKLKGEQVVLKRKRGRPRKIRRKKLGMDELGVHEIEDSEDSEGYDALSAPEMAATAIEYLEEADEIRIKCKNIKGDLSGVMKRRIHNAKEIIRGLAKTISKVPQRKEGGEEDDETCFLRMENKELQARLKEKERNCLQKEKEVQILRNELKDLSEQMKFLREEIMEMKKDKKKSDSLTGSQKGSPNTRNTRRIKRTIDIIGREEDTSVADDSEAMDLDYLPEFKTDWSEDGQKLKKPRLITSKFSGNEGALISGQDGRESQSHLEHLKQKEEQLVKKVLKESLQDIKDAREQIKRKGTLGQETQKEDSPIKIQQQEAPKPQRVIRHKSTQGKRNDIKILENVQLVGHKVRIEGKDGQEDSASEGWIKQRSRKEKKIEKKSQVMGQEKGKKGKGIGEKQMTRQQKSKIIRKPPRSSAVTIRIEEKNKDKISYSEVLKKAREKVSLEQIGIEKTKIRKTAAGNILIEIPGIGKNTEADRLAMELNKVLEGEAIIARPIIRGELRLFGLDDSISTDEIREIIAAHGKCKIEEVKVGNIKPMRNGLGMVWLRCPLTAAVAMSKMEKVRIGWSIIRIELLSAREKQCFRCWKYGHLKYNCTSDLDRTKNCYRCGSTEHFVIACNKQAHCIICKENNRESNHRMGSAACIKNRVTGNNQRMKANISTVDKVDKIRTEEAMDVIINTND